MNPRVFALPEDATAGEAVNAIQQLGLFLSVRQVPVTD